MVVDLLERPADELEAELLAPSRESMLRASDNAQHSQRLGRVELTR